MRGPGAGGIGVEGVTGALPVARDICVTLCHSGSPSNSHLVRVLITEGKKKNLNQKNQNRNSKEEQRDEEGLRTVQPEHFKHVTINI